MEAIWFTYSEKLCFSKDAMKNMQGLRILRIFPKDNRSYRRSYFNKPDSNCQDGSIEYLSNNLRWFVWHDYPWKLLPKNFNPKRLVHLDLRCSSLHYLWDETKLEQFLFLRRIDLSHSKSLKRTPDFKGMPNLEYLDLEYCTSLEEVHSSLKYCKKLIELNLYWCESLETFPYVNVESLEYLNLKCCFSLEKFPEISRSKLRMKQQTRLNLCFMKNCVSLPSSICKLKALVKLDVSHCLKLECLPEEIGDLENLEELDASYTLISRPPSSIVRLNKLKSLSFGQHRSNNGVYFVFPLVNEGLVSLESLDLSYCNIIDGGLLEDIGSLSSLGHLNLSYCNIIDGGLPEDIGSLPSLKKLCLKGNNFEHLPRSIAQLGALEYLDLSSCKRLKKLPEDIGCLSSLKELCLYGNNFEYLPQSISELGALRSLNLSDCKRLTQLPEFPQQLNTIDADWSNASICNSLFHQNISSLQHEISASDSLPLRVFRSSADVIPSWFNNHVMGNLPKNWYVSDNFLGFAVCYFGEYYIHDNITAHLIPVCDDGMSAMTQKFALSNHAESGIHFFLIPFGSLWDASNAKGKTPNDYRRIMLYFSGIIVDYSVRLLYKDEAELHIGTRKRRYEDATSVMKLCSLFNKLQI